MQRDQAILVSASRPPRQRKLGGHRPTRVAWSLCKGANIATPPEIVGVEAWALTPATSTAGRRQDGDCSPTAGRPSRQRPSREPLLCGRRGIGPGTCGAP
jgi:hypothetical protein